MGCKVGQCKTSSPWGIFVVTPWWEGIFSPWGKTGPAGHQTSKGIPKRFSKKFPRFFPRDSLEIFKEIPRKELIIHHSHIQIALETSNGFFCKLASILLQFDALDILGVTTWYKLLFFLRIKNQGTAGNLLDNDVLGSQTNHHNKKSFYRFC